MGCNILGRKRPSFSIIFLLIFSQIINITISYQNSEFPQIIQDLRENPVNNEKPMVVNTAGYYCYDFIIANKQMYTLYGAKLEILDISNPANPTRQTKNETLLQRSPQSITKEENTILLAFGGYPNTSIVAIELDEDESKITEVADWNYNIRKMALKNETLYSMAFVNETSTFVIHNATDIENMHILGMNSTNYSHNYYRHKNIPDYYFVFEKYCFFITEEGNIAVYQINSTYQLSFIKEYNFTNVRNLYFTEEYLFTCDETGLQIYNYSNVENLVLVKQYNVTNARSVQVNNEICYLITNKQFITLDLSNIVEIRNLDQYVLGKREPLNLMKIEIKDNLAFVITEYWDTSFAGYTWYVYIFDITIPNEIKRIYPIRIPLNPYRLQIVFAVFFYGGPPILIAAIVAIIIRRRYRKQRNEKIIHKQPQNDKLL